MRSIWGIQKNYLKILVALVFATNVMAQNIPSYVPKDGLVGWWPFNGNANDESGNGNHGTVSGATLTADRNGKAVSAYNFDGVSSFIDINESSTLKFEKNNTISVSFYVKFGENGSSYLFSKQTNHGINQNGWNIAFENNILYLLVKKSLDSEQGYVRTEIHKFNDNKWHKFVFIFNNNIGQVFGDGKQLFNGPTTPAIIGDNSSNLRFGKPNSGDGWLFNGQLDDIAIYNRALTEQEVKQLYEGCTKETATSSNLNSVIYTTNNPLNLTASPLGGIFSGVAVENNSFNPSKGKLGKNQVKYTFKNSTGCADSTNFEMILVDTLGNKCTETIYDTIKVKESTYDTLKIKVQLTTGIKAGQLASMNMYPNPTSDVLIIEASDVAALNGYSYKMVDLQGKQVYKELVTKSKTEISLKNIGAKGVYILHVLDAQGVSIENKKIVLE